MSQECQDSYTGVEEKVAAAVVLNVEPRHPQIVIRASHRCRSLNETPRRGNCIPPPVCKRLQGAVFPIPDTLLLFMYRITAVGISLLLFHPSPSPRYI